MLKFLINPCLEYTYQLWTPFPMKYIIGPKMFYVEQSDSWGIPDVTSCQFDYLPFTATFCLLFEINASLQFTISLLLFRLFNLLISLLCGSVEHLFEVHVYNICDVPCLFHRSRYLILLLPRVVVKL